MSSMAMAAAPPPSPQEIHRKLSVHSISHRSPRSGHYVPGSAAAAVSGTESDSDSVDTITASGAIGGGGIGGSVYQGASAQPLLSSIAERHSGSGEGEDSEDDEGEEEGGWRSAGRGSPHLHNLNSAVIKAGYLWKKGERRKTWKKRWFVLRTAHLAYYKTAAEYKLLRLLDLSDVHSCTKVALKRHDNTFGLVSPVRTFYLQAKDADEVHGWVRAVEDARLALRAATSGSAPSQPIPIPSPRISRAPLVTPSPPWHTSYMTSSDSDDPSPSGPQPASQPRGGTSPSAKAVVDPAKTILSGYLMKCGSKRRNWRKRWFVLSAEQLVYWGSHMDTKPHRRFPFAEILDALEYELPASRQSSALTAGAPGAGGGAAPGAPSVGDEDAQGGAAPHTFKIVTTKRMLLLCAPSEEDEIKWLGAVRALIARRSESGGVPGDAAKIAAVAAGSHDVSPSVSGISATGAVTR